MWTPGVLLAAGCGGIFLLALVRPTLVVWRRSGTFPVVFHREAAVFQRLLGLVLGALLLGLELWCLALAVRGPVALGASEVHVGVVALGGTAMIAGTAVVVVAQHQMGVAWRVGIDDRPTPLVTSGLFRWSRNPIFAGMLVVVAGVVLVAPTAWLVAIWVATWLVLHLQIRLEERHLLTLHGEAYARWAARTGRLVPGLGKLQLEGRA
jgi:protein-S-isoprenylcysteine O-methyltransferase Ste14